MRLKGAQLRFVLGVALLWVIGRPATLPTATDIWRWSTGPAVAFRARQEGLKLAWPWPSPHSAFVAAAPAFFPRLVQAQQGSPSRLFEAYVPPDWAPEERAARLLRFVVGRDHPDSVQAALRHATFAAPMRQAAPAPAPLPSVVPGAGSVASRWSGSAYLFVRQGSGQPGLASNGQLGGSQAAARIAYRVSDGPLRADIAARVYRPLGSKGGEAAVGVDLYPLKGRALRVSVERRAAIDTAGRDAWSAYAAGGLYAEPVRNVALDFYAQTGVVGVHSRDAFVDGAVRAGYHVGPATIGGGLWGAAQPHVARLDAGPRLALAMPVAKGTLSLAVEGRFRLAGRADPGSGVTLTLAADF